MAKITKISASEKPRETDESEGLVRETVKVKDRKTERQKQKERRQKEKAVNASGKSGEKKPFILFRPFVAFGRYLRDSWRELRQVRWPNRKATWKMLLAVLVYTVIFMTLILLLDTFFTWLSGTILGT
ncbi:preprotein translocase subunit SecE [Candidatus Saccharibacteria bacterium]|nr:preprotein translocase subunit SecE [Candidatus Saccharibacteria bacterium]